MNEIIEKRERMTSLEIAEVTGKQHQHVLRDIDALLKQGVGASNFGLTSYTDKSNRKQRCYMLTKKGCLILASGYDALLREKIINRWEELEIKERQRYSIPQTYADALMLAANQAKQIEEQQETIKKDAREIVELASTITQMQPKATYYDTILASKGTCTVTQIAQDYAVSAKSFNKMLADAGIQRKVGGQWILYSAYLSQGYVHSRAIDIVRHDGKHETKYNTEWTAKGRIFLYDTLKKKGIVPAIER